MKLAFRAVLMAAILALAVAGSVSAHTATPSCGAITFSNVPEGQTATLSPGGLTFTGNGTLSDVPAGTYTVSWAPDGFQQDGSIVVSDCETPEPTPVVTPEPTPVESVNPTPTPTGSVFQSTATPHLTPPPTDTAPGTPAGHVDAGMVALGLLLIAGGLLFARVTRTRLW